MRYRRYEQGDSLPGSRAFIRTGPVSSVWFGAQGCCLLLLIGFWPLAAMMQIHQVWAYFVFPGVEYAWLRLFVVPLIKSLGKDTRYHKKS